MTSFDFRTLAFSPACLLAIGSGLATALSASPVLEEVQKLVPADGYPRDHFGTALDMDGDTAVIGADYGTYRESAYVFIRNEDGFWIERQKLVPSDGEINDRFGFKVSIHGQQFIVGSPWHDANGPYSGAAYAFAQDLSGHWVETGKLLAIDGEENDRFGVALDLYGDTAVVGAPGENRLGPYTGAAYVFKKQGDGKWVQQAKLVAKDAIERVDFGSAVSIEGNTILVGAPSDYTRRPYGGSVYVFEQISEGRWRQKAKLSPGDIRSYMAFGGSLDLHGDTAVIGAPGDNSYAGAAYLYSRDSKGRWKKIQKLLPLSQEEDSWFGVSVALDGRTALVGARWATGTVERSGAAFLFESGSTGQWEQRAKLIATDVITADDFATSVGLSNSYAIVGARYNDVSGVNSGTAYVFLLDRDPDKYHAVIDVMPFLERNALDPSSPSLFSLAILTSEDFDALQTDITSLTLDPGAANARNFRIYDADRDGHVDMVALFRARDLWLGCGETRLRLAGITHEGVEFVGYDFVQNPRCP